MPRSSSRKNRQSGGRALMPIQYVEPNATSPKYYPSGSPQLNNGSFSGGPFVPVSFGSPTGPGFRGFTGPNMGPYPNSTATQTGGGSVYDTIVNPESGRKVSIFTKKGRGILEGYINTSQ